MERLLIQELTRLIEKKEYILFAYIFGSFVSKDRFNDMDVAIFILDKSKSPLMLEVELEREIEDALHIPADVRIVNSAPLPFIFNVLKDGVVILDRDKSFRADFEGLVYKKYFDLLHLRREYLREILNAPL